MYRLPLRTAKPLEPLTAPGCDNGPVEGLLPASPLWSKTVLEHLYSYGSYWSVILLCQKKKRFNELSEYYRDNVRVQNEFLLYFHYFYPLSDVIQ